MHSNVTDSDRLSLFQNMQKIAKFPRTFRDGRYGGGGGGAGGWRGSLEVGVGEYLKQTPSLHQLFFYF